MKSIPVKVEEVVAKNIAGEIVLLIPTTGKYFGLNAVGTSFWEKMDGKLTISEIAEAIAEEYEVDTDMVKADLHELAEQLAANQLIDFK